MPDGFQKFSKPPIFTQVREHNIPTWFIMLMAFGLQIFTTVALWINFPDIVNSIETKEYLFAAFFISAVLTGYMIVGAFITTCMVWQVFKETPPS